jgi:monoamine oxidase
MSSIPSKQLLNGKQAIVIGAGISGLSTARALADTFEQVIVLERDELSDSPISRPGVPQGKHTHVLLASATEGLLELFPGFERDLIDAGAVRSPQSLANYKQSVFLKRRRDGLHAAQRMRQVHMMREPCLREDIAQADASWETRGGSSAGGKQASQTLTMKVGEKWQG